MRRCSALLVAAVVGCSDSPQAPIASTPAQGFDVVWKVFDETYPYFGLKQVDWAAARSTYRPRAAQATGVAGLNTVLVEMLGALRDVHVSLEGPDGQRTRTWVPTSRVNFDQALWQRVVTPNGWVQARPNLGSARLDGVPYIAVGGWNSSLFSVDDLDGVLEAFRRDSVLIIDVRPNGGGNDQLALALAGRFATREVLTEVFRFRTGPGPNDLGREQRRTLSPRGPWQFTGKVFVLSGRGVFSSNESFIAAMRELPQVTIVGDTTGGGTANPQKRPYMDGWSVWVSSWFATLPDGTPIEGRGIPPDVHVPWPTPGARDPVIDAALALARGR